MADLSSPWHAIASAKASNSENSEKAKTMKELNLMKNRDSISTTILLVLGCFALSPAAQGALDPTDTAYGTGALFNEAGGSDNSAFGYYALYSNTTGTVNTATGADALLLNTTGDHNTATGAIALLSNITGNANTADGEGALAGNETGSSNTATGSAALVNNTTGSNNIALGVNAGQNLTTGDNNIDIGNDGVADEANTIRIGTQGTQSNAYVAGIYQTTVPRGLSVVVDATGHFGTKGSSERLKQDIKPMAKASEAILALRPVSFRYKKEIDPDGTPQFGLVAEDVAKVNPALVDRAPDGKLYSVRYDQVNAMLLNEFLKEHQKVQELEATVARQQNGMEALAAHLREQDSKIQKVGSQVERSKAAPRIVLNNP
jgi:trimeric autotransporter adhesin